MKENILVGAVLIAALIIFGILFSNERDCEAMGGKYVRTLYSFECVGY